MSTFNFTVRAMDNQKAYADRQFSINVKNSLVNNLIVGGTSDVFTTTDLDSTTLIQRNGIVPYSGMGDLRTKINPICYGNGLWCVQLDKLAYTVSSDGINWTPASLPSGYVLASGGAIQYVNNKFVAVMMLNDGSPNSITTTGNSYAAMFTSDDLVTWTQLGSNTRLGYNLTDNNRGYWPVPFKVTYGQSKWVISMSYNVWNPSYSVRYSGFVYDTTATSPDWAVISFPSIASSVYAVPGGYQYINGLWIFGSSSGTSYGGSNVYYTSNDFKIWTQRTLGIAGSLSFISDFYYVNGVLVSIPHLNDTQDPLQGNTIVEAINYSIDGINWTACTVPNLPRSAYMFACYNNGKLIIGSTGYNWLAETSDGKTFTQVSTPGGTTPLALKENVVGLASIG